MLTDSPRSPSASSAEPTNTTAEVTKQSSPITPRCSSPSLCLSPPSESLPSTTDTNTFDDLLSLHSRALLDYYQKWTPETAAALEFAVFDTEDDVRYYHFATTELLNNAEKLNEEHAEVDRQYEQKRQELITKHKAEADGLRLSLHEQSELVASAIMERDEITKERDLAVLHRDDLIKQLKEIKKARETDLNEKFVYQQQYAQLVEASQRAPEEIRCAQEKQRVAEAQCKETVILKETAMKVVDKVMKEREAARQEIEELRSKRLGSSDRDQAINSLSLKLGDKKRRI
jgi:hypothetical protein